MIVHRKAVDFQSKAMELLKLGFGARFKSYRSTPALQVQPGDLPILGVYILRERHLPLGSYNHAHPKFQTELTLGLSGGVHVETDKQDQINDLELWMAEALQVLLCNPKFLNLGEGITTMDRVGQYAKVGETTLYEIRVELATTYATDYPPVIEDDLEVIHVTTQFPDKEHVDSGTPQIERVYDIETTP